jgi:hypothetical protein
MANMRNMKNRLPALDGWPIILSDICLARQEIAGGVENLQMPRFNFWGKSNPVSALNPAFPQLPGTVEKK